MNEPKPYFLFTRTPLHIGAGQSVGYVDLPIQRELHTRIPIVPGSSLKGVLRDSDEFEPTDKEWLFGHENGEVDQSKFRAGALLIGEARVLCFPVRSAKGSFAWITCPLALARYARDARPKGKDGHILSIDDLKVLSETPKNGNVEIAAGSEVTLEGGKVVLEEYTYTTATEKSLTDSLANWEDHFKEMAGLKNDPVWKLLRGRLVGGAYCRIRPLALGHLGGISLSQLP